MTTTAISTEYRWFVRLWAAAELFHIAANPHEIIGGSVAGILQLVLWLLAGSVLWSPGRNRLLAVASLQLVVSILKAPFLGNHEVILWLVSLALVLSILVRGDDWLRTFVPAARAILIVAYGFIAFSKLNTGFLDASASCAPILGQEVGGMFGLDIVGSPGLSAFAIWGTLLAELAIPLLLVTRFRYGVPFALAFHFVLALNPANHIFDFSSTLAPLFLLFLPDGFAGFATNRLAEIVPGLTRRDRLRPLVLLAITLELYVIFTPVPIWLLAYPTWMVYGTGTVWLAYRYTRDHPRTGDTDGVGPLFRPLHPVLAIVVLLTAFNGLTPYLELKTGFGFNMYSNLLTARGETNHVLIPATLHLSDKQDVLVEVLETDDPALSYYIDNELLLPIGNVQNYLAARDDVTATFAIGSETVYVTPGRTPEILAGRPGWFESKFQLFRALDDSEPKRCLRLWGPLY